MRYIQVIGLAGILAFAGCAQVENGLKTAPGQLFCAVQKGGGGAITAGIVKAEIAAGSVVAPAAAPLAPIAVLATDATKAAVDKACDDAAKAVGGTVGVPVSPPANPDAAPRIAIPPA